jgi:hypothetical protein
MAKRRFINATLRIVTRNEAMDAARDTIYRSIPKPKNPYPDDPQLFDIWETGYRDGIPWFTERKKKEDENRQRQPKTPPVDSSIQYFRYEVVMVRVVRGKSVGSLWSTFRTLEEAEEFAKEMSSNPSYAPPTRFDVYLAPSVRRVVDGVAKDFVGEVAPVAYWDGGVRITPKSMSGVGYIARWNREPGIDEVVTKRLAEIEKEKREQNG